MDLDDILGGGKKAPKSFPFDKVGDKVILQLTEDGKAMPVKEFIKGKPVGEQLFWQGKEIVKQSKLNLGLPFNPVPQILLIGKTKDGTEYSIWADGEKLKALKAAVRETGIRPVAGVLVAMELSEEEDTGAKYPKKYFKAQLKETSQK